MIATSKPLAALLLVAAAWSQDQPKPRRHFAVASVTPDTSGKRALQGYHYTGDRFQADNATLVDMIVRVYPTRRIQMEGGPGWIDSDRFDVVAKADVDDGPIAPDQWRQMVQVLLEDRFQLRFHVEQKERPVLALVPAKAGATLTPSKSEGQASMTIGPANEMIFKNMPIEGLVNTMANVLHIPVIDKTGIAGHYDFTLEPLKGSPGEAFADTQIFGDLFTAAVRDQLGLRLEKQKAMLDITVIENAERPQAN